MRVQSRCIKATDPDYPVQLKDLERLLRDKGEALPDLYVRGSLPAMPGVAVVGTRHPSEEAVNFTGALVDELVRAGLCIWSGGALGIDGAAHEAALSADGATVVVMGGGLSQLYPPQHRGLFERVLQRREDAKGALVARVPDDTPPLPMGFCKRNEVLAAATMATVVIQAGFKSGARNTAAAARKLGRPLFAVPFAPWDERGQGCAVELALGARALTCAADLLEVLAAEGLSVKVPKRTVPHRSGLQLSLADLKARQAKEPGKSSSARMSGGSSMATSTPTSTTSTTSAHARAATSQIPSECETIFSALTQEPQHLDEICEKIQGDAHLVLEGLLTLTLLAVVVEEPAGFYRRRMGLGDPSPQSVELQARSPPTVSTRELRD